MTVQSIWGVVQTAVVQTSQVVQLGQSNCPCSPFRDSPLGYSPLGYSPNRGGPSKVFPKVFIHHVDQLNTCELVGEASFTESNLTQFRFLNSTLSSKCSWRQVLRNDSLGSDLITPHFPEGPHFPFIVHFHVAFRHCLVCTSVDSGCKHFLQFLLRHQV